MKIAFLTWASLCISGLPGNYCAYTNHPLKKQSYSAILLNGADQMDAYLPYLKGKKVGYVINNNSLIGGRLTSDTLRSRGINMIRRFGPERVLKDRQGKELNDSSDHKETSFVLLYGDKYKPAKKDLEGIDIILFDVQDLGVRFYIYLSTLHYMMEACAENNIELLLLDRPNPIGSYVDGPVLDKGLRSYLGVDPIPIAHGLTPGEYACMINGEGWLEGRIKCPLTVIRMKNYQHGSAYPLKNPPFPNLNSQLAIGLYPSLCWFDGTVISQGRGTTFPFTVLGNPLLKEKYAFSFKPASLPGLSLNPRFKDTACYGMDLRKFRTDIFIKQQQINVGWLLDFYAAYPDKHSFFIADKFDRLAGTSRLREQIIAGVSESGIRNSWKRSLNDYKTIRKKYLMYD